MKPQNPALTGAVAAILAYLTRDKLPTCPLPVTTILAPGNNPTLYGGFQCTTRKPGGSDPPEGFCRLLSPAENLGQQPPASTRRPRSVELTIQGQVSNQKFSMLYGNWIDYLLRHPSERNNELLEDIKGLNSHGAEYVQYRRSLQETEQAELERLFAYLTKQVLASRHPQSIVLARS